MFVLSSGSKLMFRKKSIGIFLRRFPTTTWVQMNWVEQRCVFYFNLPQPRKGMTTTSGSFFRGDDEGGNQDVKQRALYVSKMGVSTRICWLKWLLLKLNALLYKSLTWYFTNSGTVCNMVDKATPYTRISVAGMDKHPKDMNAFPLQKAGISIAASIFYFSFWKINMFHIKYVYTYTPHIHRCLFVFSF